MRRLLILLSLIALGCTAAKETYYTQKLTFPADATTEEKIELASRVVPSKRQLAWQEMELTAFIHFGINTFTDQEWGDGTEDPDLFNPTELDCEQWVTTLKRGGFKMVILTAKHHDGFCLWPTTTTPHSVAHSAWREGKGDVVRELSDACRKHGLKFGVYLSPWDRNAECYGDSPAYNRFFIAQLTELLTNYGRVDEVWFDGACAEGPNGKRQVYDWPSILATIDRLQPNAVTAIMGDDIRWVGNEGGRGRLTEWSATPYTPLSHNDGPTANAALGLEEMSSDLGSRELVARAKGVYWYPSEVDVSIRPGWFYHEWQDDEVRSLANLVDIYYTSVGRNSVLLLNVPPDRRGLIHEIDAERIEALGNYIDENFTNSKVAGEVHPWHAEAGESRVYEVESGAIINTLLISEDIERGQRVERFTIEAYTNGRWHHIAEGTTIGYKRIVHVPTTTTTAVRVNIEESEACPVLNGFALFMDNIYTSLEMSNVPSGEMKPASETLIADMGEITPIRGFVYAPKLNGEDGVIVDYKVEISDDGSTWTAISPIITFNNIVNNPISQEITFSRYVETRYLKLIPVRVLEAAGNSSSESLTYGVSTFGCIQ